MNYLKIHPDDNVWVALRNLEKGCRIEAGENHFLLDTNVPAKHKFSETLLQPGDKVFMYGIVVGEVVQPIKQGELINTHNIRHAADSFSSQKNQSFSWQPPDVQKWQERQFMGYYREDGRVGTANNWLFVPLVFCENRNLDTIEDSLLKELGYSIDAPYHELTRNLIRQYQSGNDLSLVDIPTNGNDQKIQAGNKVFENIDGIKFLKHQGGCGGTREDSEVLCQLLAGYICHPNTAGVTVLSLGCQHAQIDLLRSKIEAICPEYNRPLLIYEQQQYSSERTLLGQAIKDTFIELSRANKIERKPAPLSRLTIGLECGGSDGFSGISANPAMGHTSDLIVVLGGSAILSEFPELCGVEQALIDRCVSKEVADKFYHLQQAYARSAETVGSGFDMNPSPGNIKDGLITDAIKSAGAAKKGGTSPITGVLDYTEQLSSTGLNLLCTPGNDVESTTGLAGSGANLILFSTGLGTPTGNPAAPTLKISSNSALARKLSYLIDIDAGPIINGEKSVEETGEEILEYCIKVASGEVQAKADRLNQFDFIPWKRGVSL